MEVDEEAEVELPAPGAADSLPEPDAVSFLSLSFEAVFPFEADRLSVR
ncbi:MAG TPA: hypothetical protein VMD28_10775 [Acidimicrobiales bacterium]|nr:hypothetical protein [Acidimicrobiales bacterium]